MADYNSCMNIDLAQTLLGLCIGVGLAAACGFRVFVPLLVMGIAQRAGYLPAGQSIAWVGSLPAIVGFGAATAIEIAGYYVPFVDHLLDTIATPAAGLAGTLITGAMLGSLDPMLQWTLAVIAGGGSAMTVQALTVGTRALSTATTGGLGNPVVSTVEATASTALSVVAVVMPILAVVLVVLLLTGLVRIVRRRRRIKLTVAGVPEDPHAGIPSP